MKNLFFVLFLSLQMSLGADFFDDLEYDSSSHGNKIEANEQALKSKIKSYREFLAKLIQRQDEKFYDLNGNCAAFAGRVLEVLQSEGFPVQFAQTAPSSKSIYLQVADGSSFLADKIHFFVVDRELGDGQEIIIDPTVMQFFDKRNDSVEVRKIFVGTRADLLSFYSQNRKVARFRVSADSDEAIDPNQGAYDPEDLVCVIYSVNECAHTRTNL